MHAAAHLGRVTGQRFTAIWISFRKRTGWPANVAGLYFQSRAAASSWLS